MTTKGHERPQKTTKFFVVSTPGKKHWNLIVLVRELKNLI